MRKGWEVKKLGVICENLDSKRIPITQNKRNKGEYPYYGASGIVDYVADYIFDDDLLLVSEDGANLLARTYPIAFPISGKVWVNNHAHVLKFESSTKQKFVEYYLNSIKLDAFVSGMAQPKLNQAMLNSIPIPIPPHPEQQRIVAILDEALEAINQAKANTEKNLQNAKELFQSELNSIFTNKGEGWVEKRLKDICDKITDGTHQTPKYFEQGHIFLSSRNVTTGVIDWDNIKYIDDIQHIEMQKRVSPRRDDILLAKNGTTGVAALVDRDISFDLYVSLALIRSKGEITPPLLLYFINSPRAKEQFNKRLKGIGVPNLHLEEIREVEISFPKSIQEQLNIVNQLDALSAETKQLEENYRKKLESLEELKKSILQKAFRGELTTVKEIAL
jgi:type I restriction enzyme S subunit